MGRGLSGRLDEVVDHAALERSFKIVVTLCAAYAGVVLVQGATKLGLNVYRG